MTQSIDHQAGVQQHGIEIAGWDSEAFTQVVEGVHGRTLIGVQWHPEYLFYLPAQLALFRWLVRRAT